MWHFGGGLSDKLEDGEYAVAAIAAGILRQKRDQRAYLSKA